MRKRTLYWILAALFAASAIYAPFDDNRDSGLPLTIVTIIALVALAVGFAMAARKVDPEARFKKKPKSVTKMKSKPVKAKDLMVDNYTSIDLETTGFSPAMTGSWRSGPSASGTADRSNGTASSSTRNVRCPRRSHVSMDSPTPICATSRP